MSAGTQLATPDAPEDELLGDEHLSRRERFVRVAHYFGRDVRKRRRKLAGGMLFSILLGLARVAEPWPLKVVFDQVLFHRPARGFLTKIFLVFGPTPTNILSAAAVVLMLAGFVHGVSYYFQDYLLSTAAQEIVYSIRARLYRHLHRLDLAFHIERPVGDTLVRLSADIIMLRDVLIDGIVTLGSGLIMLVLMLVVMLLVDPLLTLLAVSAMPLAFFITWIYGGQIRVRSRKQRRREGNVAAIMHESLAAIATVQLHGAEDREELRFRTANRLSLKEGTRTVRLEAQMNRAIEIALALGMVVVLWAGTLRAMGNHISPGDLVVFTAYLRAAFRPLRRASKTVQRSAKALAAAERIAEVLEIEPKVRDAPGAREAPRFSQALRLTNVRFAYRSGAEVLRDVSLELPVGGFVALVGPTGSGKSTLLSLLPRLQDPTGGTITFDGVDLRDLTLASLRSQISVVQQEAVLMGLSLAENIRYGCPEATDEQVAAAALDAGLGPLLARLPEGLECVVAERGASLSGGERQRVTIARALVRDTPILLLDEPTTGLDPQTKRGVVETLVRVVEDRTAVVATHDMELAARAEEILLLVDGQLRARGSHEELASSSLEFRRLADQLAVGRA
ncbi:MAG TPA: ABC transporter ATP-binding protein [Solirubrobacteraceae bacterium]|nr:ABC transporter ATP-binding protein [Solirubrobacteraceae bacterium]